MTFLVMQENVLIRKLRGRQQIVFVMLSDILVAKVLPPPPLTLHGLHTMVFNHGALKTCANSLSMWHFFSHSLNNHAAQILKANQSFQSLQAGAGALLHVKTVFFVTINTLNEYMVSQFGKIDTCVYFKDNR